MGVFGLMSHCLQRKEECMEFVDLIEVAKERNGIQLLVDFYSFEHLMVRNFFKSLSSCSGNTHLRLLGGEYGALDVFVTKLVKDLQSVGIELVMFIDGAKGSSKSGTEQKLETWKNRHHQDMNKLYQLLDVLNGQKDIETLDESVSVRPVCLEMQIRQTLKHCNCEVIQLASGEADYVLARNLKLRPKAYAVLSNDSDFCIFENCFFIPNEMFDTRKDLQLGSPIQWLPEKPKRLECGIISTKKVIQMLEFESHSQLVDMAVVMGTDFTSHFMKSLKPRIGFRNRGTISETADWIKQYGTPEGHPAFKRALVENREFSAAVDHSRRFYGLCVEKEDTQFKGAMTSQLVDGIQAGLYPANLMSMHLNFYWYRMLLEDCSPGCPSAERALAPLRGYIYRIVLPRNERYAVEYGRSGYEEFTTNRVQVCQDSRVPSLDFVNKEKIFHNLRVFHSIMIHQEPDFPTYMFDKYGRRTGFILLCLRYFLLLNTNQNLHTSLDEFLVVTAMAFSRLNEPWYVGLCLKPSVRCVTVLNWFQAIYRHAYSFLGSLLHLTHEFPSPKDMFSGAVFTALYMVQIEMRGGHMNPEWSSTVQRDYKEIINEKRHIIKNLVTPIYNFR